MAKTRTEQIDIMFEELNDIRGAIQSGDASVASADVALRLAELLGCLIRYVKNLAPES